MSHHSFPPTYHYLPDYVLHGHDQHKESLDRVAVREACFDTPRSLVFQPMARFLDETDHPLFTATSIEQEATKHAFPSNASFPRHYGPYDGALASLPMRYPSPTSSGFSSSRFSSNASDCELAPFTPPDSTHYVACTPEATHAEATGYGAQLDVFQDSYGIDHRGSCVALHEVQAYADTQCEKLSYEDDRLTYGYRTQEGYQPMQSLDESAIAVAPEHSTHCSDEPVDHNVTQEVPPVIRRRRAQSNRSITSPHLPSRIIKRPSLGRRQYSTDGRSNGDSSAQVNTNKSFPCPFALYGCTSTFGSKNEWKRHVNTQHMRLGYWRCDQCPMGDRKPNDFNRKDLFIQHVRRMHPIPEIKVASSSKSKSNRRRGPSDADDRVLADTATRCYRRLRTPPEDSGCLFCEAMFHGPDTWDERLEHIGRHMETAKKDGDEPAESGSWYTDEATETWLAAQKIIVSQRGRLVLTEGRSTA